MAIALTSPATIKQLSDAAQRAPLERRRRFASLEAPWPNFVDSVREVIDNIVVSHRVSKKVSGPLHEETIYSAAVAVASDRRPAGRDTGATAERHVRKPLAALTKSEVEDIADEAVKRLVLAKLGDGDPKKVFADPDNLPFFETEDGRRIPIRRVRVKKKLPILELGSGRTLRHVTSESNHHLEVFAELDENGNEVEWDGVVVSMAEAYRRKKLGLPIVQRDHGPQRHFKFSLGQGEVLECDDKIKKGTKSLYVTRRVSQQSTGRIIVGLAPLSDARKAREMQIARDWLWAGPDGLRERNTRKVAVSPLGEVTEAHD